MKELVRKLGSFRLGIALESDSAMIVYLLTELINIFTLYSTINIVTSFRFIQKEKEEIEQVFCYVGFLDLLCSISFCVNRFLIIASLPIINRANACMPIVYIIH